MSEAALATTTAIERALVGGDLKDLAPPQRIEYYNAVCNSLGLNPLTKPFAYIALNGKLLLYALKDCTEQLRKLHNLSLSIQVREVVDGVYVVTARAMKADGRQDESIGAVPIDGLKGEARANAMMKAETKAKRRVTLSICGLGMLDETELDTIPSARFEDGKQAAAAVAETRIHQLTKAIPPPEPMECPSDPLPEPEPSVAAMEQRAARPATAKAPTARAKQPPPNVGFDLLAAFAEIKKLLREATGSDDKYYLILRDAGYAKSSAIPDVESGRAVWKTLANEHKSLKTANENRRELAELRAVAGEDAFWTFAGAEGYDPAALEAMAGDELQAFVNKLRERFGK